MAQPVWNTPAGSIGTWPSSGVVVYQLSASAQAPATTMTYTIISGSLPTGVSMNSNGLITGTANLVGNNTTYPFVVRATDDQQNIRDRTFSLIITSTAAPALTTIPGVIATILDSTWFSYQIQYSNPITTNPVVIRVNQGQLPPGIEINEYGLLRGYAAAPVIQVNLEAISTSASVTIANTIICLTTAGFTVGRPVVFSGSVFGGVNASTTYYVSSVIDTVTFTISETVGGPTFLLTDTVGYMTVTLPTVSTGQPTIETYSFTLELRSPLGSNVQAYAITVQNQNALSPAPNAPPNTRVPAAFNTRPQTYNIGNNEQDYGYYVLPANSRGNTYEPSTPAYIGQIASDTFFSFSILGYDFDSNPIAYSFQNLPSWATGNPNTGWITGIPIVSNNTISDFSFSVSVAKANNPAIVSPTFNFSLRVSNDVTGVITWVTPSNMGQIYNGTVSTRIVQASSDVPLSYRLLSGSLPPNLTLLDTGEISGVVAYQPNDSLVEAGTTTDFTFTVQAYSPTFPAVTSTETFTLSVYQEFSQPTDTLYIQCSPSVNDRNLLSTLLNNTSLIPTDYLYRADDPYFGKATDVIYEHAYGIYASDLDEYVAAITKNHYWRNITLGQINIATARDSNNNVLYEVVYSEVIDNLVNPSGVSVSEEIYWPRLIPLNLGPWYSSETDIFTSYIEAPNGQEFYTSLTPGFARSLYPNSLDNMRERVAQNLGQVHNSNVLPLWMTSQQPNGSTLGYTPAWVIAYCAPGTTTLNGSTVSYAQYIQYQIQNNWLNPVGQLNTLNTINFKIDRFMVDKSITYNYENTLNPPAWTGLPSATPTPDPLNSENFQVLFPRPTILPTTTQYEQ